MHKRRSFGKSTLELLGFFAVLYAIDAFWMNGDAFANINPNPYWLPVLIVPLLSGTAMGLAAAVLASLLWIAAPHQWPAGTDTIWQQFHLSITPLLWMVTAMVIGEVTASRQSETQNLARDRDALTDDLEQVANRVAQLNRINRALQVRIATDFHRAGQAITLATGLVRPDIGQRMEAVGKLISLAVETEDFTCYELRGNKLVSQFRGSAAQNRPVDASDTSWAQAMLADPENLFRSRQRARTLLGDDAIAALPIHNERTGALAAVLVIHEADRLRLTAAKMAELSQVANSLGVFSTIFTRPQSVAPINLSAFTDKVA